MRFPLLGSSFKLFLKILGIIAAVEVAVMFLLPVLFPDINYLAQSVLDALLLALISAPFLWRAVVLPLKQMALEEKIRVAHVIENVIDGIVAFDDQGTIDSVNPAAERIFGYHSWEVVGKNLSCLIPLPYLEENDSQVAHFLLGKDKKVIGIEREVTGKRKDGTTFAVELTVSEGKSSNRRLLTGIIRDITDRKKLEQMKDEFISTVSHELRTPLSTIKASVANLRDGIMGALSDKQGHALEVTSRNIDRLARIITDILDLSRLESGKAVINCRQVDAEQLIDDLMQNFQNLFQQKGLILRRDVAQGLPPLYGDSDMVFQVLSNLLNNAIRFARQEVVVKAVGLGNQGSDLQISIIDDGPGIPPQKMGLLFNKFVQLQRPTGAGGYKGTGLGLAICKEIMNRHGGKIWAESKLQRGSEFHVMLPSQQPSVGL